MLEKANSLKYGIVWRNAGVPRPSLVCHHRRCQAFLGKSWRGRKSQYMVCVQHLSMVPKIFSFVCTISYSRQWTASLTSTVNVGLKLWGRQDTSMPERLLTSRRLNHQNRWMVGGWKEGSDQPQNTVIQIIPGRQ